VGDKVDLKHIKKLTISMMDMRDFKPEVADTPVRAFGVRFDIEMKDPDQSIRWQSTFEFVPHADFENLARR
jgi:hypothetical protein